MGRATRTDQTKSASPLPMKVKVYSPSTDAQTSKSSKSSSTQPIITTKDFTDFKDATVKLMTDTEERVKSTTHFLLFVASGFVIVLVGFVLMLVPFIYEIYQDNWTKYEIYLKDVNELKIRVDILEKNLYK